MITSYYRSRI